MQQFSVSVYVIVVCILDEVFLEAEGREEKISTARQDMHYAMETHQQEIHNYARLVQNIGLNIIKYIFWNIFINPCWTNVFLRIMTNGGNLQGLMVWPGGSESVDTHPSSILLIKFIEHSAIPVFKSVYKKCLSLKLLKCQ